MRTDSATLSVLMPVYNCERYVAQAIQSVIDQTFTDWHLLLCDDGSLDGTRKILETYAAQDKRIQLLSNGANLGKIATIERLYPLINGRYVVFHDSDDISHPDRFLLQVTILERDKSIGLVGCGYTMVDAKNQILGSVIPAQEHEHILEAIKSNSPFHFPTVMFRKSELDTEEKLFRDFFGDNNEDVDLAYRVLTKSRGMNVGRVLYVYRILQNSISRKRVLRNAIFFYSVARDLALARISGNSDWLDNPIEAKARLRKYERLQDTGDILIYANCVSYFLSYDMRKKAIIASFYSFRGVPVLKACRLIAVTLVKVLGSMLRRKEGQVMNFREFSRQSIC